MQHKAFKLAIVLYKFTSGTECNAQYLKANLIHYQIDAATVASKVWFLYKMGHIIRFEDEGRLC
jgi:divalent metal cation (Fe/Co/Zn/Cd) transporter